MEKSKHFLNKKSYFCFKKIDKIEWVFNKNAKIINLKINYCLNSFTDAKKCESLLITQKLLIKKPIIV